VNILVVEDVPDVALTFAALLRAYGHRTQVAYDAASALAMVREFKPHTVFIDVCLPGMDGYELAKRLRAVVGLADALLVSVSGHEIDEAKWHEATLNMHLQKPVTVGALVEVLSAKEPHKLTQ
jgi:two-component system CheB/CheR fusion protein